MWTLIGFLLAASPVAGILGTVEAIRRKHEPIMVLVYAGWAMLAGVGLLVMSGRFWRLHAAGESDDRIMDFHRAARLLTVWGLLALGGSVAALVLLQRRRRRDRSGGSQNVTPQSGERINLEQRDP